MSLIDNYRSDLNKQKSKNQRFIHIFNYKNIGEIAITETHYGAHIEAIFVKENLRKQGYGRIIVSEYTNKYAKVTANVLFEEIYNKNFWSKIKFKIKEINSKDQYILFEKINNTNFVNPCLFYDTPEIKNIPTTKYKDYKNQKIFKNKYIIYTFLLLLLIYNVSN